MADVDFDSLLHLLQASSKDAVVQVCDAAYGARGSGAPDHVVFAAATSLSIGRAEAAQLVRSLSWLTQRAVADGLSEPSAVQALFPGDFHKNLRDLLTKIIVSRHAAWKQTAVDNMVSLPRLLGLDWTVSVKSASNSAPRLALPACLMHLQLQEGGGSERLDVELSRQTLDTMLDGLGRIRDQLQAVADR